MRTLVLITACALFAPSARAGEPRQHDGFYLRLSMGPGGMGMKAKDSDARIRGGGGGGSFSAAAGGALTQRLVLYGEFFVHSSDDPRIDGTRVDASRPVSSTLFGIGPGVSYCFMPLNLYVSGTVALMGGTLSVKDELDPDNRRQLGTKAGLGVSLMVGKEWWMSSNWGLGVAARFTAASMKDDDIVDGDTKWNAGGFALLASGTYN